MNTSHENETTSIEGYNSFDDNIDQHDVMGLPVFGERKQKAPSQQRKKKMLKPKRRPDTSAVKQQQCLPKNTVDTNRRTGMGSNTYNMLLNDQELRIAKLKNKLSEASSKNHELTVENRLLKIQGLRYEQALSVHEGNKAKLPQIIKSHEEEIRTLKERIRKTKASFTEMEGRYKSQTNELLNLRNQHTRLLSLPKKGEPSNINALNDRLKEAYNTIKQQQNEILNFKRKNEIQNKTHRIHSDSENRLEIQRRSENIENSALETKQLNARQDFAKGSTEKSTNITRRVAESTIRGQGDAIGQASNQTVESASLRPELPRKKYDGKYKPYRNREKWNKY